jgi:NADH-quinone oxidoreductase subunit N
VSAPLILTIGSVLIAAVIPFLRIRREGVVAIAVLGAAALGAFALLMPIEEALSIGSTGLRIDGTWTILGRALTLDDGNRTAVGFLYLIGAFMFGGTWMAERSRYLPSVGLIMVNVVAASLMVRPFLFAALFVELAAMGAVLILVEGRFQARKGALRLLVLYTLGMIVLLWAGWLMETGGITSGATQEAREATIFLALGFAVLLGIPPFHIWLPTAGEETNPYGLMFVAVILQSAGLFFLLYFLNQYPWLRENEALFAGARLVGLVMVIFGGAMAFAQKRFSKMMAYALMADFGVIVIAVGSGVAAGYELAIGHSGARAVSLSVWALGIAVLKQREGGDSFDDLEGSLWGSPYVTGTALVGLFAVGGLPLTAGFPGRWALMTILAPISGITTSAVLIGIIAITMSGFRWMAVMMRSRRKQTEKPILIQRIFLMAGLGLCIVLGLFPQLTYPIVVRAGAGLINLVP